MFIFEILFDTCFLLCFWKYWQIFNIYHFGLSWVNHPLSQQLTKSSLTWSANWLYCCLWTPTFNKFQDTSGENCKWEKYEHLLRFSTLWLEYYVSCLLWSRSLTYENVPHPIIFQGPQENSCSIKTENSLQSLPEVQDLAECLGKE